jgi:hypothetical protein
MTDVAGYARYAQAGVGHMVQPGQRQFGREAHSAAVDR